jgi:hypothetical protein
MEIVDENALAPEQAQRVAAEIRAVAEARGDGLRVLLACSSKSRARSAT